MPRTALSVAEAVQPEPKPARVFRFVDTLPDGKVAELDQETNVLVISKPLYERADEHTQRLIRNTQEPNLWVDR